MTQSCRSYRCSFFGRATNADINHCLEIMSVLYIILNNLSGRQSIFDLRVLSSSDPPTLQFFCNSYGIQYVFL